MDRGYVKLWRKVLDTELMHNHKLFTFWCWCLLKASHKKHTVMVGYQEVILEPGQFIFGRTAAKTALKMTDREIRTCIDALHKHEKVTIKPTNKFSIVSIINWGIYQQDECHNDQQHDQQATSKRPAADHKQECIKNGNNGKNIYSSEISDFVCAFSDHVSTEFSAKAPKRTDSLFNNSCDVVDKLIRLDGFSIDYIKTVLRWAVKDDFWQKNVLSLAGLRKTSGDGLTKFQKIVSSYESKKHNGHNGAAVITSSPTKTSAELDAEIERLMK